MLLTYKEFVFKSTAVSPNHHNLNNNPIMFSTYDDTHNLIDIVHSFITFKICPTYGRRNVRFNSEKTTHIIV